jgi:transglutaminase-like putative cysteine protease
VNHRLTITAAIATVAASLALIPLLSGGKWFFGGLGAVIVVAAVGTATRHRALRALPAVVCLLCSLVALVLYLNLVYSSKSSLGGIIPTPHSLSQLWSSAVNGLRETQKLSPPVASIPGIELLASGGIGLVAALTDLIAVRLRRCALAGLPLLVLFSVPVASNASKSSTENVVFFCFGIAGYLALLSADGRERLRLWGRLVTPWNAANANEPAEEFGTGPSSRALASSGRRIGVAAVVLAMFAPLVIPGLHAHRLLGSGSGSGTGTGSGTGGGSNGGGIVNPMVQMTDGLRLAKPSVVFTYHTTDTQDPPYLTEFVLNKMSDTGASWAPPSSKNLQAVTGGDVLPPVPGYVSGSGQLVTTQVHMQANTTLGQSFLPVPYAPRVVGKPLPANGLSVDPATLMIESQLQNLFGATYTVKSYDLEPTPAEFTAASARPAGMGSYLTVPKALQSLRSLARQIVGTASTPYTEAQALQAYLTSNRFSYDVDATEPDNASALRDFLLYTRTGYCQQFSFAMTVLARLLGIPAQVAVGYDHGTSLGDGNYRVETTDEHAWTQLYFSGLGWTEWDPTPSGSGVGQANIGPPGYTVKGGTGGTGAGGTGQTGSTTRKTPSNLIERNDPLAGGGFRGGGPGARKLDNGGANNGPALPAPASSNLPILLIALAVLAVAALVAPRTVRSWTRRRRWAAAHGEAGRAHAAWAELLDDLTDYGLGHGPGETPRALARRIELQQKLGGAAAEALNRLARAEERASYAREPEAAVTLPTDVVTVRRAVSAEVTRSARWGARLLPPSAVDTLRHVVAHALDAFGWLEVAIARLFSRLGRKHAEQN